MTGANVGKITAVLLLCVSCASPPRPSPSVVVLIVGPGERVEPTERAVAMDGAEGADPHADARQAMRYLVCAPDGRSYAFAVPGRFDVQVVSPAVTSDSPYSICIGAPGALPTCKPVVDGGWTVEVRTGDEVTVRSSAMGSPLDARLCPGDAGSPLAEWSLKEEARASTSARSLPLVAVVAQELAPGAKSRGRSSAIDVWIRHAMPDVEGAERWEIRFLACAPDGRGYRFTAPGRFDLLAIGHARRLDSPYAVCVGATRRAPMCHALADGRSWQVDVRSDDEITIRSFELEAPLDARLCPSNDRSSIAEWSRTTEALRATDQRPLPYLGIIARRVRDQE